MLPNFAQKWKIYAFVKNQPQTRVALNIEPVERTAIFNYVGLGSECAYPLGLRYLIMWVRSRMCLSPGTAIFNYVGLGVECAYPLGLDI